MNFTEKLYIGLCVLFSVIIVIGNLTYQKIVNFSMWPFGMLELSVGALTYPFTFVITDLITEIYGKEKAKFCTLLAILSSIFVVTVISFMTKLEATPWSKLDNETFAMVFGMYGLAFVSSLTAMYIAQNLDIILYAYIKKLTKGKFMWLRNSCSTAISLFIDTMVVLTLLGIFGVFPKEQIWPLILNSYKFKLVATVFGIPLLYLAANNLKKTLIST